jgi:N-acetylmuramoyl-L-alanine amidase
MAEYAVKGHFLYKDGVRVSYRPSPNIGNKITPGLIVIHYTGDNSLDSALSWLTTRKSKVSAHLVIAKNGAVYQLVPFNVEAWHAGTSSYEGRSGVNGFGIGIENVGIGDKWPAAQVEANRDIISALFEAYQIEDVVGHSEVAPGRKVDPGPNYPWSAVTDFQSENEEHAAVDPPKPAVPKMQPAPILLAKPEPKRSWLSALIERIYG